MSPMADFGYDVSNFTAIDPLFGTMQDFDDLINAMHDRGMYLIMDFVPNHCSNQHIWFKKAIKGDPHYRNYFIWKNGTNGKPPNNWISCFGNSSWELEVTSDEYYLHQYLIEQPDLNYRNEAVREEMKNVLDFWLRNKVDGFRVDAIVHLYEDARFPDEPIVPQCRDNRSCAISPNDYEYQIHKYNIDQNETYTEVTKWAELLRKFEFENKKTIFSCTEAGARTVSNVMRYYKTGISFTFNFYLQNYFKFTKKYTSTGIKRTIDNWMKSMPAGHWPNWVLGNHDNKRIATRLGGSKYTDVANMLLLLLPGTPTSYYGDEIGMTDVFIKYDQTRDPAGKKWGQNDYQNFSRDPERTGMQWNIGFNAGFSSSMNGTWLPISPISNQVNVQTQVDDPRSHLNIYRNLVQLRSSLPIFWVAMRNQPYDSSGSELDFQRFSLFSVSCPCYNIKKRHITSSATNLRTWNTSDDLFVFTRTPTPVTSPSTSYIIMINIGHGGTAIIAKLNDFISNLLEGRVVLTSGSIPQDTMFPGEVLPPSYPIVLRGGQGVIIETTILQGHK